MASKVGKIKLVCGILEAKEIKCFKRKNNLLSNILFIEVKKQSSNYKS